MAPPREMPKVTRRRTGGLTSNALVSGVVAAIVAGRISFAIAHYQDQAARQAMSAQRASAAPQREMPKVTRRRTGGLTSNALVSTVVAAIVAGGISFAIAHYQDQDAARQAMSAQRASTALQLETAATGFYQATFDLWPSCEKNPGGCLENTAFHAAEITFNAAVSNVSDPRASALALQLDNSSTNALTTAESRSSSTYLNQVGETYGELIARCAQLVQNQQ